MANTLDPNVIDLGTTVNRLHDAVIAFVNRIIAIKEALPSGDYTLVPDTVSVIENLNRQRDNYAAIDPPITVADEERVLTVSRLYTTWTSENRQDLNQTVIKSAAVRDAIVAARNRAPADGVSNGFDRTYNATTFAYKFDTASPSDVTALETAIDDILRDHVIGYDTLP